MGKSQITFKYGRGKTSITLNTNNIIQIIEPNEFEVSDEESEIVRALNDPIGAPTLYEIASQRKGAKKDLHVVVITSDITRPTPTKKLLPHVLRELRKAEIPKSNITILFALGIHRSLSNSEMKDLVGDDIFNRYRCINHDTHNCIFVNTTSRATRVFANKEVLSSDVRVCLGTVELHYFAGYSGGYKSLLPGVCARETIESNHKLMLQPNAEAGRLDSPVREDLEEAGQLIGCDFIVNVVLNSRKQIVKAVAGDPILAHRKGAEVVDSMYIVPIHELADVVLASAGGSPKDINLFQAQKALDNAKHALKDGGAIILAAECPEGLGEKVFERWLHEAEDRQELIDRLDYAFEIGGHKAGILAKLTQKADIYLVSELQKETVEQAFLSCSPNLEEAVQATLKKQGPEARIILMPFGAYTLPRLE
ncbi:MAG: nickel-dependent lactate racemase family protein [Halobacteriota archaeon]